MARRAKVDRPVERKISLPTSVDQVVQEILFSKVEQRVPHGALSAFIEAAVREKLQTLGKVPVIISGE